MPELENKTQGRANTSSHDGAEGRLVVFGLRSDLTQGKFVMTTGRRLAAILAVATVGFAAAFAQDGGQTLSPKEKAAAPSAKGGRGGFPDLVKGLKETPGCLGVETARSSGGKNVIFAWFKDKKSAIAWYKSDMHVGLMKAMGAGEGRGLVHVEDDGKPIMVIASITPSEKPMIEGVPIPISQISIEMYAPLPGGASIGGTFAPKEMEIPHMKKFDKDVDPAKDQPEKK